MELKLTLRSRFDLGNSGETICHFYPAGISDTVSASDVILRLPSEVDIPETIMLGEIMEMGECFDA